MMKENQRQDGMRRPPFMPDKDAKQNDTCADERGLHQPDLSFTEIDKCPHQTAAAGAGEKRTGKIESPDTMPDTLVHSGDHEEPSDNGNRNVDQESPAPRNVRHDQRSEERSRDTRDRPGGAGCA